MIRDLVETGQSILMLGRPVGKTTACGKLLAFWRMTSISAWSLSTPLTKLLEMVIFLTQRLVEHVGCSSSPELQHQVMIEAVENHMPEVIVIDEMGRNWKLLLLVPLPSAACSWWTAHGNLLKT